MSVAVAVARILGARVQTVRDIVPVVIEAVRDTVETAARLGIRVLTLYAFSVENWKRPRAEVSTLMLLLKHYLRSGASAYLYWNISLEKGGLSRWGWARNSLVTVDRATRGFAFTHEYYLMKHLSAFVRPGARRVLAASWTGYENQLAFVNPDGSTVVVIQNDMAEPMPVRIAVGGTTVAPTLPADSFSTLVVSAPSGGTR